MYRKDYLIHLIEQAGAAWARVVELIKARQVPVARKSLDQAYQDLVGIPPETVRQRTAAELFARMRFSDAAMLSSDRCVALAILLRSSGDLAAAEQNEDEQLDAYHKALAILLETLLLDPTYVLPRDAPSIESLEVELDAYVLPLETQTLQLRYYEQTGDFARAEDVLFEMLETAPEPQQVAQLGYDFYDRLLARSDEALIAGNLPRDEVEEGLDAFEAALENEA